VNWANSKALGEKYEPPRAMRLRDAAMGVAADDCYPQGSSAAGICLAGHSPLFPGCDTGTAGLKPAGYTK
jgi:hypothetical protein